MFLSTRSLSIVYTFSWEYTSISSHIVVCPLILQAFTNQNATQCPLHVCLFVCLFFFFVCFLGFMVGFLVPDIGLAVSVFANGPGDLGSIPSRVIPKTQKMVLDASLLNTQQYKVRIKGKVEQSRERSSALPYTLV